MSAPTIRQRDLQPTDARYDAFALLQEERDDGLSPKEIFQDEPRDPVFAPVMEKRIRALLDIALQELQLGDKIRQIHTACKTLSSYTHLEDARSDGLSVYNLLSGVLLGDVQNPGLVTDKGSGVTRVTFYNVYRPAMRDEAHYKRFLEEGMRRGLEFAKQRQRQEPLEGEEPQELQNSRTENEAPR